MPVRQRKDLSEDLKMAVLAHINAAMPYRKISTLTGLSIGAIASIKKVSKISYSYGNRAFRNILLKIIPILFVYVTDVYNFTETHRNGVLGIQKKQLRPKEEADTSSSSTYRNCHSAITHQVKS